ncbi:hypothetical protein [Butyrivibrio sp. MB2005]|uniref:hypothetical protein n=1 Tax=Butyrivibrio sp. MB2005 TaxID=1280678 RepID=UPI0003FEF7EF|nr:hypothetical protein [Butyrivibrio sp. MB2005]
MGESINANNKIKAFELFYYIYFLILFGARAIGFYDGQTIYNVLLLAGAAMFGIKIISTRHTLAECLIIICFLGAGSITYACSGEKGLLIYFTMMLGMKGINEKKVMRLGLYILGISYFVLYVLSMTGLIQELNHMNNRSGFGYIMRHSLGYPYPNTTHTTLLILIMLFFYLYKAESFSKLVRASLIAMLLSCFIYVYTVSLTGLISISIYLVANLYLHARKERSKLENALILMLFPATVIFSIAGPLLATGDAFEFMNKLLHKRYEYALYFLTNEKITPFGSYFGETPTSWYMLDNSFLYLFLQLGIVSFILICSIYLVWIKYIVKNNKKPELAIMITFCFIGMSDPFLFNLSYKNLTFVFIGAWLYDTLSKKAEDFPELLRKEIILLPLGEKEIVVPDIADFKLHKAFVKTIAHISCNFLKFALLFAVSFILASGIYYVSTTEPKVLYTNTEIADPYFNHKNIEMTQADVDAALAKGDIVEGYHSSDPTMYIFKKTAPHMEYIRSVITCGFFAGIICVLIFSIGRFIRKR